MSEQPTNLIRETENFEAFDLVTEALEKIDSYDPKKKNLEVLHEAEGHLAKALADDLDPHYLKAQYFRGIVRFLENRPSEALSEFERMGTITPGSAFGKEVRYNIAASYSALGNWETAIAMFNEVLEITEPYSGRKINNDSEVRLLTHTGLAFSYAGRIGEVRKRIFDLEKQDSKEAIASREREEQRVEEYLKALQAQYHLARDEAQGVSDQAIVQESEQIFRDAYNDVEGPETDRVIELVSVRPKKRRLFKWLTIVLLVLLIIFLTYEFVQIYLGWDHVWG